MRQKIVAGNWKMHGTTGEARELARAIVRAAHGCPAKLVLCPAFTALAATAEALRGTAIALGAQDLHWEAEGPWTGEVSASMLKDVGCTHVIVGHSERRTSFGETDDVVRRKLVAALAGELTPIVCVGETLGQREAGTTEAVLREQLEGALGGLEPSPVKAIVAYEPVWAIGTGRTATPGQVDAAHRFLRGVLAEIVDRSTSVAVPILYGGSIKPANARELFALPDVDGGLVGGASLDADSFAAIARAAC